MQDAVHRSQERTLPVPSKLFAALATLTACWVELGTQLRILASASTAVVTNQSNVIDAGDLPADLPLTTDTSASGDMDALDVPLMSLRALERAGIVRALRETNGDSERAASLLGISPKALESKRAAHGLVP